MFRVSAILLLGFFLAAIPVGLPANPISSENLGPNPQGQEAPFVLELIAELAER